MESILRSELEKACKLNGLEVFSAEQLKQYATEAYNTINKSEGSKEEMMRQVAIELKSFTPFIVWDDKTLEKSIQMVRPAQVIWDDVDPNSIQKARGGVYAPTPENRKLGRVGQRYGGKKDEEPKELKESKGEKTLLSKIPNMSDDELRSLIEDGVEVTAATNELKDRARSERFSANQRKQHQKASDTKEHTDEEVGLK